jgi:hypothetical protein
LKYQTSFFANLSGQEANWQTFARICQDYEVTNSCLRAIAFLITKITLSYGKNSGIFVVPLYKLIVNGTGSTGAGAVVLAWAGCSSARQRNA